VIVELAAPSTMSATSTNAKPPFMASFYWQSVSEDKSAGYLEALRDDVRDDGSRIAARRVHE
jgi:hypothetical protein